MVAVILTVTLSVANAQTEFQSKRNYNLARKYEWAAEQALKERDLLTLRKIEKVLWPLIRQATGRLIYKLNGGTKRTVVNSCDLAVQGLVSAVLGGMLVLEKNSKPPTSIFKTVKRYSADMRKCEKVVQAVSSKHPDLYSALLTMR